MKTVWAGSGLADFRTVTDRTCSPTFPLKRRRRRRASEERGISLITALGLTTALMIAALYSLSVTNNQSDVQGASRREREALFAAKAGLAEARVALAAYVGGSVNYNTTFANTAALTSLTTGSLLPDGVTVAPIPVGQTWYRFTTWPSWQEYSLRLRSTNAASFAVDDSGPGLEILNAAGTAKLDFPEQLNTRYTVFIRNDDDNGSWVNDVNARVWIIAVGQVLPRNPADRPTQAVVQALVTINNPSTGKCSGSQDDRSHSCESTDSTGWTNTTAI